ncbi:M50 family metallopeptidase [Frankia sp. AiPa1]|uniref:M50 family metallopeptidase n=1 Tax=Frankia sp. AiPa1 TaxID=573492 RepID=UPI00202B1499|nr:M50 family metallopeptidase [Frankia sp. AiPa1]MCL9761753.1 M50 family metallopeptidase [Frankia sp. AiPa1]
MDILRRSLEAQPDPPSWVLILAAVLAAVTVLSDQVWPVARHVITIAHEGGHALIAVLSGRRLAGVRLHSDTSGVTVSSGRPTGPGVVATVAAGYPAPSLLGLGATGLLATGRSSLLLQLCVALLLAMLVVIRNGFGVLSLAVSMGVILVISWFAPPTARAGFAAYIACFLLLGALRPVVEVQRQRRRRRARDSDPDQLARLTRVPGAFWVGAFGLCGLGCVAGGADLLFGWPS